MQHMEKLLAFKKKSINKFQPTHLFHRELNSLRQILQQHIHEDGTEFCAQTTQLETQQTNNIDIMAIT